MAIDNKYGEVHLELGNVPRDEPGIWFRGRDKHILAVIDFYRQLCAAESPSHHMELIDSTEELIRDWQVDNPDKVVTPTSDYHQERLEEEMRNRRQVGGDVEY